MDTNLAHTRLTTKPFAFSKIQEPGTRLPLLGHRGTTRVQPLGIRTRVMDLRHHSQAENKVLATKWRISSDGAAELNC